MWEIRIIQRPNNKIIFVEFWNNGSLKFVIHGSDDGTAEVLTSSAHFRAKLIPNIMNGLYVDTKKPNSAAGQ